ncbi:hypothetical protein JZ751_029127 [Albula glossodonta]|uniref:Uncharacterized protein n=1 Tax=Albula glossodonta TaxID=121402 RepID=A0A8T2PA29_9TELE|nr:hypothetical protein JZ751_029127 [Albula glossodonta]
METSPHTCAPERTSHHGSSSPTYPVQAGRRRAALSCGSWKTSQRNLQRERERERERV